MKSAQLNQLSMGKTSIHNSYFSNFLKNYYLLLGGFVIAQAVIVVINNNTYINQNQDLASLKATQNQLHKDISALENQIAENKSLAKNKPQEEFNDFIPITDREIIVADNINLTLAQK